MPRSIRAQHYDQKLPGIISSCHCLNDGSEQANTQIVGCLSLSALEFLFCSLNSLVSSSVAKPF